MIWVVIVVIVAVGFFLYRGTRQILMSVRAGKLGQTKIISRKEWGHIDFNLDSAPLRMILSEIATKQNYRTYFEIMVRRFIDNAMLADTSLNEEEIEFILILSGQKSRLYPIEIDDFLDLEPPQKTQRAYREYQMIQAAFLFAIICTQGKGANVRSKLMQGKNKKVGGNMYIQKKTDRKYFEYMNNNYTNFCLLVGVLEPRKSVQIEIVAGYLLTG
ncbi:MAG: hypothetical protein U0451_03900 [Candidatus Saccharimonadales bacterium]